MCVFYRKAVHINITIPYFDLLYSLVSIRKSMSNYFRRCISLLKFSIIPNSVA